MNINTPDIVRCIFLCYNDDLILFCKNINLIITEYSKQTQIILDILGRDRKELADKLSEVDKLIKSIKLGCFNLGGNTIEKPGVFYHLL